MSDDAQDKIETMPPGGNALAAEEEDGAEGKAGDLHFHITRDKYQQLTLEALIALEEFQAGGTNYTGFRDMMAPFLVDQDGDPIPLAMAARILGRLRVEQLQQIAAEFSQILKRYAVPKKRRGRS